MKHKTLSLLILFALLGAIPVSSCNRGVGCPATESLRAKPNKKGEYSSKKGSSQLFPKDMRKKMKR